MSICRYSLNNNLVATGMPEIKQWLFEGGLEMLLPNENAPRLVGQVDNKADTGLESLVKQYASESNAPTRAEMAEALRQYREVEQKYFNADGSQKAGAMTAPNGEKTNLNQRQWIMTRTGNFLNWFGDWINSPESASKVVDSNGEPLVQFHKTGAVFSEFNPDLSIDGFGIHFGSKRAARLAQVVNETTSPVNTIPVFLNIKNLTHENFDHGRWTSNNIKEAIDRMWIGMPIEEKKKVRDKMIENGIYEGTGGGMGLGKKLYNIAMESSNDVAEEARIMTNMAYEYGFDGFSYVNTFEDNGGISYVVIKPHQIKSATGNTGAFSTNSNDIRFSRRLEDLVESSLPKETAVQEKRRQFQDAQLRFKVLQEDLEIRTARDNGYSGDNVHEARAFLSKNGIENPINDKSNYYLAQSTTEGIATEEIKDFQNDVMQPLIKESGKAKIQMADISDYMLMRYALTNPDMGISTTDANAKITEFQSRPDFDKLKSLADRWQSQVAVMNAKLIAAGLPAKLTSLPIDIPTQKSGESDTSFALRLKRTVQSQNVIENILHDYEKSVYAIEHNKIALSAVEFIKQANDPEIGILNPSKLPAEGKFTYFVAGEKRQAQFNDPLLARAYKENGINEIGAILNQGRIINTYLSTVYTAYSPTFLIKNPIRDAIQGFVTNTGNFGFDMAKEIFTAYPSAAKELYRHFKNHGSSSAVNLYRKSGGSTGAAYMSDRERIGLDIMDSYNEYAGAVDTYNRTYQEAINLGKSQTMAAAIAAKSAVAAGIKKTPFIGHFLRFMENSNAVTENALRLATFNTLIKHGYSEKQAAGYAKDLMNFNRKGELGAQVSALWLFSNPSFQGTQVMMSTLTGSKYKGQSQILTGTIMLAAFLVAESMRGGDDDDEQKWKMLPANLKDRNIIFNTPFTDMPLMLPVPYGYGVFHSLGNAISDVMHGESTYKASLRVASAMIENFSPFGNPMNSEHAAFQLMPTLPKMALSPSINENNFSAPIAPEKWKKAKPDSQNMYRGTKGTFFAQTSEFLNEVSGGNKYQAGMIDISPEVLKFWNSSILGGSGQFFADSVGLGSIVMEGAEPNVKDIPVVKAFAHEISVQDARRAFWLSANEAQLASDQFAAAKSKHDKSMMIAIKSESGDLISLAKTAHKAQKMASKYRDAIDAIRFDDSLTLDEKRTKQKELEDKEAMVYTKFLSVFDKKTNKEE